MAAAAQKAPKLRFPGFDGAWEIEALGNRTSKIGSGVTPKGGASSYVKYGIPLLRSQNVRDSFLDLSDVAYITPSLHQKMSGSHIRDGDVLLNITGASIGRSCVVPIGVGEANANQHVCIIRLKGGTAPVFVQTVLDSEQGRKLVYQSQAGGGREGLNFENIRGFKIAFPDECEQRKIASFLGAVDRKITQLGRKKALLQDYKKGCMQQLFSRAVRFRDDNGDAFPDWEEKRLGKVVSWVKTNSLSRDQLTYEGGSIQNIHYGDIHTKFRASFRQGNENAPFIADLAGASPADPSQYCEIGDILIADASEDHADIGKAIEVIELTETPIVAGLHTHMARPNSDALVIGFSGYLLRSPKLRRQIMRIAQGISVLGISKKNLEKLVFEIPHPDEQRKIADFLSAIDAKIDLTAQQLAHAQTFKKGLLQQMFV